MGTYDKVVGITYSSWADKMAFKRKYNGPSTMAKRLKRVEYVQRRRKPEMKYHTVEYTSAVGATSAAAIDLTGISLGNDVDERTGNHIRVVRIEVRGSTGHDDIDLHLIQCHTTTVPAYANFQDVQGGGLVTNDNNTKFTEWKHMNGHMLTDRGHMLQRFKYGINVKYNGSLSSNCVDNRLYLVYNNHRAASTTPSLSIRVWYIDN